MILWGAPVPDWHGSAWCRPPCQGSLVGLCGAWSTKLHTSNRSQNMDWVPCYHPNTARTDTFFVPQISPFHQEWKTAMSKLY